jgi:putative sterol carrier protein
MAVRFLSEEWAQAFTEALNSSPQFVAAASKQDARVQQVVTDAPNGEVKYYFAIENGAGRVGLGDLARAEATVTQDYATAVAISKRELHPQHAFKQGNVRITGNLMKLLQLQGVLSALGAAVSTLDVDYEPRRS